MSDKKICECVACKYCIERIEKKNWRDTDE